ncbi:TMV resistance protein N-like protein [Tanacetum coccineum]
MWRRVSFEGRPIVVLGLRGGLLGANSIPHRLAWITQFSTIVQFDTSQSSLAQSLIISLSGLIPWTATTIIVVDTTLYLVSIIFRIYLSSETDYITKIVHTVDSQLDLKQVSTPAHLTGMETRAEVINSWLKNEESNCNILGIWGMPGIGKTTLSQYIYNLNKKKFESSSFLDEIGKHCQQPLGLHGLQKQLLRDILGGSYEKTSGECTSKIEEAFQMKRVLIVLDDIDEYDQLDALLGRNTFPTQSKIIITTRYLDILDAWFGAISRGCKVYELKLMNEDESLELLCWHAFGSKIPMKGFKELAVELAQYCRGNPLALKVLGSSLFVKAEDEQKRNDMIDIWRSTLTSLNSLKGDIHSKIQCILRRSFDSLPREIHKELFLHICFFFVGEYEDYVVTILEHEWHAKAGIMTLINRCLLTVSPSNKLMMHQLLQDMGRQIVLEESKNPAKRSRVHDDESYHVLDKGKGSKTIEGLALNKQKLKQGTRSKFLSKHRICLGFRFSSVELYIWADP